MQVFSSMLDCLDFLDVSSGFSDTRDQTCWLAKTWNSPVSVLSRGFSVTVVGTVASPVTSRLP